jgi:hypothetical protein
VALNSQVGTVACPASTGTASISLPANFDPKVIMAWSSGRTAAGGGSAHQRFALGVATARGGTVAMRWAGMASADAAATSTTYAAGGSASLLRLNTGNAVTTALDVTLSSFTTGVSSAVTLNWVTVSSGVIVNYLVLGGSDVVDALVSSFSIANAATTNVTVATGFGQPDVIFFPLSWNATGDAYSAQHNGFLFGWGTRQAAVNGRGLSVNSQSAVATQASEQMINNNRALYGYTQALDTALQISGSAAFPTDGFQITRNNGTSVFSIPYLAIRLSASCTVNTGEAAASTTLNGTNTLTGAASPQLALVTTTRQTTANTVDTTSADVLFLGVGAADGAGNQNFAGGWDDDAQATASVCGTNLSTTRGLEHWVPPTDVKDADATIAVSGNDFVTTWTDAATGAFLYEWLTLSGPAAVAAATVPPRARRSVTRAARAGGAVFA